VVQSYLERKLREASASFAEQKRTVLQVMRVRMRIAARRQQLRPTEIPLERRRVVIDFLREGLRQRMKTRELAVARSAGRRIQACQRERNGSVVLRIDPLPQRAELQ